MIRPCKADEFDIIWSVINDGAQAYTDTIPTDCLKNPYMSREELRHEIEASVVFWAYEDAGRVAGVMGIQELYDVTLIRHAYVRTSAQGQGIGSQLLSHLRRMARKPLLIGTWADAEWALGFYAKHGFAVVAHEEKEQLLRRYWTIPQRQIETSVVLASPEWRQQQTNF